MVVVYSHFLLAFSSSSSFFLVVTSAFLDTYTLQDVETETDTQTTHDIQQQHYTNTGHEMISINLSLFFSTSCLIMKYNTQENETHAR